MYNVIVDCIHMYVYVCIHSYIERRRGGINRFHAHTFTIINAALNSRVRVRVCAVVCVCDMCIRAFLCGERSTMSYYSTCSRSGRFVNL